MKNKFVEIFLNTLSIQTMEKTDITNVIRMLVRNSKSWVPLQATNQKLHLNKIPWVIWVSPWRVEKHQFHRWCFSLSFYTYCLWQASFPFRSSLSGMRGRFWLWLHKVLSVFEEAGTGCYGKLEQSTMDYTIQSRNAWIFTMCLELSYRLVRHSNLK